MEFQDKLLELSYCRQCKNKKNTIKLVVNKIICNFAQSPSFCEIVKQSCMIIFLFYIMNSTHVEFAKKKPKILYNNNILLGIFKIKFIIKYFIHVHILLFLVQSFYLFT